MKNNYPIQFDFWACQRQLTRRWGCPQILMRVIKEIKKPDICFGKTDGTLDIPTVDIDPLHSPTYLYNWKNMPFQDNQFEFGFWDPPYDHRYDKELREIWRVCKSLAILHQLVYPKPKNAIRTHMIAITTGPNMRIRILQVFKKGEIAKAMERVK